MGSINHNPVPKIRIWLCHQKCSPENFVTINEENERVALPRGNIILKRTSRRIYDDDGNQIRISIFFGTNKGTGPLLFRGNRPSSLHLTISVWVWFLSPFSSSYTTNDVKMNSNCDPLPISPLMTLSLLLLLLIKGRPQQFLQKFPWKPFRKNSPNL